MFLTTLEAEKSKNKVLAHVVSSEARHLIQRVTSSCGLTWWMGGGISLGPLLEGH